MANSNQVFPTPVPLPIPAALPDQEAGLKESAKSLRENSPIGFTDRAKLSLSNSPEKTLAYIDKKLKDSKLNEFIIKKQFNGETYLFSKPLQDKLSAFYNEKAKQGIKLSDTEVNDLFNKYAFKVDKAGHFEVPGLDAGDLADFTSDIFPVVGSVLGGAGGTVASAAGLTIPLAGIPASFIANPYTGAAGGAAIGEGVNRYLASKVGLNDPEKNLKNITVAATLGAGGELAGRGVSLVGKKLGEAAVNLAGKTRPSLVPAAEKLEGVLNFGIQPSTLGGKKFYPRTQDEIVDLIQGTKKSPSIITKEIDKAREALPVDVQKAKQIFNSKFPKQEDKEYAVNAYVKNIFNDMDPAVRAEFGTVEALKEKMGNDATTAGTDLFNFIKPSANEITSTMSVAKRSALEEGLDTYERQLSGGGSYPLIQNVTKRPMVSNAVLNKLKNTGDPEFLMKDLERAVADFGRQVVKPQSRFNVGASTQLKGAIPSRLAQMLADRLKSGDTKVKGE